ncbi:MAG TPA: hypothetical protein VG407_11035 [Caulobacteraceae bacterium]|jgi:hypothetical protein|nr:hypothetical protein [Caulobacteraceae bacterium]
MDIHKPKPFHGWREFLKEYGIIVLGVLTALALEQVVEKLHQLEQAKLAEHAMRLELGEDDGPQAYGRVVISPCLDGRIAQIHDAAETAPGDQLRAWAAAYAPPFRSWDSEAWKAVASSNVGDFMGPERLIDWSAAYRILPGLTDSNASETELLSELRDATPAAGEPSAADRHHLRELAGRLRNFNDRISRGSQLFLSRSRRLGVTVPEAMQQTLLKNARAIYGACVRAPDLNAPAAAERSTANLRGFTH